MYSFRAAYVGVVGLALSVSGCTPSEILGKTFIMYPGERRPPSRVSIVECNPTSHAVILEVDGRPKSFVNCAKIGGLSLASAKVHLLPGKHTLRLRFWQESLDYTTARPRQKYLYSPKGRSFQFVLEPGKTYFLRARAAGNEWTAKLEKRVPPAPSR